MIKLLKDYFGEKSLIMANGSVANPAINDNVDIDFEIDMDLALTLHVGDKLMIKEDDRGVAKWVKWISDKHKDYCEIVIIITEKFITNHQYNFFAEISHLTAKKSSDL